MGMMLTSLMEMKNVIITGSSGMIGSLILENCLQRADVGQVTTISRKLSGIQHPKLKEVLHDDYLDYSLMMDKLSNQQVCFFCIGVYTGQVAPEEFRKITVDYTTAFAKALRQQNEKTTFCFLSGQGADQKEKSRIMFARDKGAAENRLLQLHFERTHIFRPGYIYPVQKRKEPNFLYRLMRLLYKPLISKIYPNGSVSSKQLADVMVEIGMNGGSKIVYENRDIRNILV